MHWIKQAQWIHGAVGVILISTLSGCDRDDAKVYHVPKDNSQPAQPAPATTPDTAQPQMDLPTTAAPSIPQIKYHLPAGWQEKPPTEMRVASFTANGSGGQSADISVIPLPIVGRDVELINMWRSQVQLPATTDPNAVNKAVPVAIGSNQGRLFEFVSDQPMIGNSRQRNLIAMLTRDTMSWFFKISGEDAFITSQKTSFIQFLKSVSFVENAPGPMPAAGETKNAPVDSSSIWAVPPGWQAMPPSQFLLAEFSISGAGGAKADVNVAELDGKGGGLLANINRWRGQIGLSPIGEADLPKLAQSMDVPGAKATGVDFTGVDAKTGAPTRLVGVIVAQDSRTWFYKLMGDKQVVAQQKDSFTKFIQSANYANAR